LEGIQAQEVLLTYVERLPRAPWCLIQQIYLTRRKTLKINKSFRARFRTT